MPPEPAAGYAPLGAAERQRRRAVFLQSYQFSVDLDDGGGGVRKRAADQWLDLGLGVARRLREAVARAARRARGVARWWVGAGLGRAWRVWRPRADPLLGCFGGSAAAHHKYYLHDYA